MLILRLLTAAVLALVLLPSLFFGPPVLWAALSLAFLVAAAWEWARLKSPQANPFDFLQRLALPIAVALPGLGLLYGMLAQVTAEPFNLILYALAGLFWLVPATSLMLRLEVQRVPLSLAWVLLTAAWLAVVDARLHGVADLLSIIFLVIAADTFAYFAGRAFGRHKLAPTISPGKTIEGAIGGVLGVFLVAAVCIFYVPFPNFFSRTWLSLGWLAPLLWLVLTALSILGDLFESSLKRAAGAKDSSQLLPGHGGVLDRVDALLPVLPVAMLCLRAVESLS